MAELEPLRRNADPKINAEAVRGYLNDLDQADGLSADSRRAALLDDARGLLAAVALGLVRTGQPRIADRLLEVVALYPDGKDPRPLREAIAACAEYGLTADGHPLGRAPTRTVESPAR